MRTEMLLNENCLLVEVDNGINDFVYPQKADFTFYGGIYRDAKLLVVNKAHFDLDTFGGCGVKITASIDGTVQVESRHTGENARVEITLLDAENRVVAKWTGDNVMLTIKNPHLWQGIADSYLYSCKAELFVGEACVDYVNKQDPAYRLKSAGGKNWT